MKKTILLLALAAMTVGSATAQKKFRIGMSLAPTYTWITTPNDNSVTPDGGVLGLNIGANADVYFGGEEKYALTIGASFSTAQGGTLVYSKAGYPLQRTKLSEFDNKGVAFAAGAKIRYVNQYVEIPLGLKIRNNINEEMGIGYYINLPIVTIGIRTQSQGDVVGDAADPNAAVPITKTLNLKNENIGPDMAILNLSIGAGAGVEYSPDGGKTIVTGGIQYQHGLIDQTTNFKRQTTSGGEENENSNAQLGGIGLRVGVYF